MQNQQDESRNSTLHLNINLDDNRETQQQQQDQQPTEQIRGQEQDIQ